MWLLYLVRAPSDTVIPLSNLIFIFISSTHVWFIRAVALWSVNDGFPLARASRALCYCHISLVEHRNTAPNVFALLQYTSIRHRSTGYQTPRIKDNVITSYQLLRLLRESCIDWFLHILNDSFHLEKYYRVILEKININGEKVRIRKEMLMACLKALPSLSLKRFKESIKRLNQNKWHQNRKTLTTALLVQQPYISTGCIPLLNRKTRTFHRWSINGNWEKLTKNPKCPNLHLTW